MKFATRLALFLTLTLAAVQTTTVLVGYAVSRAELADKGQAELANAAQLFRVQLQRHFARASDAVRVLSLDFALRGAIAHDDLATIKSALANHGQRAGANRMMLVRLDGSIAEDTGGGNYRGRMFPFGDLLARAEEDGRAAAMADVDGKLRWIIAATVDAPDPTAYIVALLPIDGPLLSDLRKVSALSTSIALVSPDASGTLTTRASAGEVKAVAGLASVTAADTPQALAKRLESPGYLVSALSLDVVSGSPPIVAIFEYPLSEALRPYNAVFFPLIGVLLAGLVAAIAGANLIARRVSQPLEALAQTARRIQDGRYDAPTPKGADREVLDLANALGAMAHAVAERQASLERAIAEARAARDEAEKANRAKSDFLANMSHELRTPMNAILGFSEMIKDEMMGPISPPKYKTYATDIHSSGAHLLSLIDTILDLSKLEAGKFELQESAFDFHAVAEDAWRMMSDKADKKGVRMNSEIPLGLVILAEERALRQVVCNLLSNAVKFTAAGGSVTLSWRLRDDVIEFSVCDTGCGVRPGDVEKVFECFAQGSHDIARVEQGTGLGLPISRALMRAHGGDCTLTSELGKGTTVTMTLSRTRLVRASCAWPLQHPKASPSYSPKVT